MNNLIPFQSRGETVWLNVDKAYRLIPSRYRDHTCKGLESIPCTLIAMIIDGQKIEESVDGTPEQVIERVRLARNSNTPPNGLT